MLNLWLLFVFIGTVSTESGLRLLFPSAHRQYVYSVMTNVSTSTLTPRESGTYWTIEGKLLIDVRDNFTRARLQLKDLKKAFSGGHHVLETHGKYITDPWEIDYQDSGNINYIYIGDEPTWFINLKRALSVNFQLKRKSGTYTESEPCLDGACVVVYTVKGDTITKFIRYRVPGMGSSRSWSSVPWSLDYSGRPFIDSITSAERVYKLDNKKGLLNVDLKGGYQYKTHEHILAVTSRLKLTYLHDVPGKSVEKTNLTQTTLTYEATDFSDLANSIRNFTQNSLKNRTQKLLLKISKGIDADNIVRNPSLIHSLDFIELLNILSQLGYKTLIKLFEDLVLGTSYEMETSRNIFLEVLPHARSEACAKFIKYLVMEEKEKIEDAALLSLIRKLPFNIASLSQKLLEELEVFTRLGLDYPAEIRYAGILSFATLVHKTMESYHVKQDYFDNIVVKYFRMYSDCPQYLDRMIWLQGLCNLGFSAETYTSIIYADSGRDRHERLWTALAIGSKMEESPEVVETSLSILTNETEDIQLRIVALHLFLSSQTMREGDFMFVHNYIKGCNNKQLKRFWYTTVKNLESSKTFSGYRVAAFYVPFVVNQISNPDPQYLATNNYIVSGQEDAGSPSLQVLSVGESVGPFPTFVGVKLNTGGRRPYKADIYFIVEGMSSSILKKILQYAWSFQEFQQEKLLTILKSIKSWKVKAPEKVHIDIIVKLQDKTVFATHMNQSRFDSLNGQDFAYIEDFLRFGSHINQQIVYYPFQSDVHVASELGTPIRLQSTILSFTSIRGNLTAPTTQDSNWRIDLHIRYQGTAITSLSVDGPLVQTTHAVRIQQSMVAHLPMKFNITFSNSDKFLELTWLNPGAQHGGIAMHSRAQISVKGGRNNFENTITVGDSSSKVQGNETSLFFDCERPMTTSELFDKLLTSKSTNYGFLKSLQPSHMVLNTILLFTSPPSGSCGMILSPPRLSQYNDDVIWARIKGHLTDEGGATQINTSLMLGQYSLQNPSDVFLKVRADAEVIQKSDWKTNLMLTVHGQSHGQEQNKKRWTVCFHKKELDDIDPENIISLNPVSYGGEVRLSYSPNDRECSVPASSEIDLCYKGSLEKRNGKSERNFEMRVIGRNISEMGISKSEIVRQTAIGQLLSKSYSNASFDMLAIIKEKNGMASLILNDEAEVQFSSDDVSWFLDRWSSVQTLKNMGIYRDCHLTGSKVKTFAGDTEMLEDSDCPQKLIVADCSDNSPRFAVIKNEDSIKVYTGGYYVTVKKENSSLIVDDSKAGDKFWLSNNGVVKIKSRLTAVTLHINNHETLILVPYIFLETVCGLCDSVSDINNIC